MSTGYDSFWMYQNNRPEPVLNLPKNDNYSHAILTDSYKQVQNGGQPSHLNSYLPPQNNTQSSYQYNQHRTGGSQYVWQSSVYSMPLKASCVNNFHAQEAFSIHSNNIRHSFEYSHAQQNLNDYRYLKNVNASVAQQCSSSDNSQINCSNSVLIKDNHNINKPTARIRVKDVFSLNNNITSKQGQNTSLYQTPQKEQPQCALNYGTINHNTTYNSKTQSYFNYGEGNPHQPNHPPPYYRSAVTGHDQQFPQTSNQFYPQNAERQPQLRTNIPRERNFNMEPSQARVDQNILKNILNVGSNQDSNVQNISNSSEPLQGSNGVKSAPRNSVKIDNSGMIKTSGYGDMGVVPKNCNQKNVTQFQNRRTVIEDTHLSKSKPATAPVSNVPTSVNAKSPAHQLNGRQDTTVIKISIPHTSQETFIALTDCNSTNESLSLPCLLESKEWSQENGWITQSNNNTKENSGTNISVPLASETGVTNASGQSGNYKPPQSSHNAESPFQKTLAVPPRKRFCQIKDPLIGLNKENLDEIINSTPENTSGKIDSKMTMEKCIASETNFCQVKDPLIGLNKENLDEIINSTPENTSGKIDTKMTMEKCIARETNFQQNITLNTMTLKQENFNKGEESPAPEQNISESRVSFEIIKREEPPPEDENPEYSTADEHYGQSREESNILDEQFSSVIDIIESTELCKAEIQKLVLASEIPEASAKDSENSCVQKEAENNKTKHKSGGKRRNSSAKKSVEERKIDSPSINNVIENYKSKINRDKLDMLIQFLEKDDLPSNTKSGSSVEKKTDNSIQKRQEVDMNHNRRKLKKTCVVKNKNNSREMVSMVSHKTARVEVKSASQTTQTVKPANSTEDDSIINESESATEKHGKSNSTSDSRTLAEDPPRSKHIRESSRESSPEDNSDSEEQQNVMQRIRALQNLKTVFCGKCNLTLTLDQFWINLVSGELKCLNCFKEMTLKDEENTPESKGVSKSESKCAQYDKTESNKTNTHDGSNGNNLKDTNRLKGSPQKGSKNSKETIKHELMESPKKIQMANSDDDEKSHAHEHSRKDITGFVAAEQKKVRKEIPADKKNNLKAESYRTRKYSEDGSNPEMRHGKEGSSIPKDIISGENCQMDKPVDQPVRRSMSKERYSTRKSEKSKRSTWKEEEIADHTKREEKEMNHSNQIRKRSESRDSSHRGIEEHSKKDVKTAINSSENLFKKSRESHTSNKDSITEQTAKKSAKYEHSEPKIQTHSKESYSYQKPKTSEQVKEFSASEESKAKSTSSPNSLEKPKRVESTWQPLKRKHSDENADAVKVRIVEDSTKKDLKILIRRTSTAEEDTTKHKNKIPDRDTEHIRTYKFRRSSSSKEEEQSKKETNGSSDSSKRDMSHHKSKTQEHEKQKGDDTAARKSKEYGVLKRREQSKSEVKQTVDTSDLQRRKSTSKDEAGSPIPYAENKDRKKTEEREKNSSGKTAKSLSSDGDEQSGNSVTASRQLKENQNTKKKSLKSKTTDLHEQKVECKKNAEDGKDEKKHYKRIRGKEIAVDDEKKCSDHSERMCQTGNKHGRGFDEASLGEKKEVLAPKEGEGGIGRKRSTSLLAKLMKKTKKLSWSLLDEA